MSDDVPLDLAKLAAMIWGKFMIEKRYPDAILVATLGYLSSRSRSDKWFEDESLSQLFRAVEEFQSDLGGIKYSQQRSSPICSLCGRSEPDVRLVAGARGFICNVCAQTANDVLAGNPT